MTQLEDELKSLERSGRLKISNFDNGDFMVSLSVPILRINYRDKFAEFLNLDIEEWDELDGAIDGEYKDFPEVKRLKSYLTKQGYRFGW